MRKSHNGNSGACMSIDPIWNYHTYSAAVMSKIDIKVCVGIKRRKLQ